jgi:hypothetical protein
MPTLVHQGVTVPRPFESTPSTCPYLFNCHFYCYLVVLIPILGFVFKEALPALLHPTGPRLLIECCCEGTKYGLF